MKKIVLAAIVTVLVSMAATAGIQWLESVYRSDLVACSDLTSTFTVAYTNSSGSRVTLASVFARSDLATNSWQISLVNNGQTNVLVAPTLLLGITNTVKYDGTGNVPLGNGGVVQVSGTIISNAGGSLVRWNVNTKYD
jgi:hypothetical protein